MSLHSVSWRVHCSAVDDVEVIEAAMSQLSSGKTQINKEKSKSHHGAPQTLLEIKVNSKKEAKQSLRSLGESVLNQIMENGLDSQIDEDKVFHIRLSLSSFVAGNIRLAEGVDRKSAVKGRFKIESYPGQDPREVLLELIKKSV